MNKPITVINIRKANLVKLGYRDLEHWLENPNHIYIGRNMTFYVPGAVKSKWSNPYSVKKYGRDKCLEMYEQHIKDTPELLKSLKELQGKTLGCWCHPEACHGHVLQKLLNHVK